MIDFDSIWCRYPMKDGKKQAKKFFDATVKTEQDWRNINTALRKYKNHLFFNRWKNPKNGSTWFNSWEDWIDFKEPKDGDSEHAGIIRQSE